MSGLTLEIAAFKEQLAGIRREHGSSWAVMAGGEVQAAFPDFAQAAVYVEEGLVGREALIRHTDDPVETMPFLMIRD